MSSATQFGTGPEKLLLTITDPSSPRALAMLYAYYDDVASSYYGRPATPEEVSAAMLDEPSDDLRAEEGIFAIATRGAATGWMRRRSVRRLEYWRAHPGLRTPGARKTGVGATVVGYLETQSRNAGLTTLRLDTRLDLVDARRLYERLGYTDVAPFTDGTYSEVWLSKGIERSEDPKASSGAS